MRSDCDVFSLNQTRQALEVFTLQKRARNTPPSLFTVLHFSHLIYCTVHQYSSVCLQQDAQKQHPELLFSFIHQSMAIMSRFRSDSGSVSKMISNSILVFLGSLSCKTLWFFCLYAINHCLVARLSSKQFVFQTLDKDIKRKTAFKNVFKR